MFSSLVPIPENRTCTRSVAVRTWFMLLFAAAFLAGQFKAVNIEIGSLHTGGGNWIVSLIIGLPQPAYRVLLRC